MSTVDYFTNLEANNSHTSSNTTTNSSMYLDLNNATFTLDNRTAIHCTRVEDFISNIYAIVIVSVLYGLIGVLGLVGNIVILVIVTLKREMRTITNLFICNLALSDIVLCLTSLWMTPMILLKADHNWPFGRLMCYGKQIFSAVSFHIAAYTLVVIAIDRYVMIMHPFCTLHRSGFCAASILLIWSLGITMMMPYVLHTEYIARPMPDCPNIAFCSESKWHLPRDRILYGAATILLKSFISLAIIAFCYTRIRQRLDSMHKRLRGRKSSCRGELAEIERKRSLQRILILMVVIYGVSMIPLDLTSLLTDINWYLQHPPTPYSLFHTKHLPMIVLISHWFAMTATLWNPILYAWWNENFKKELIARMSFMSTGSSLFSSFSYVAQNLHRSSSPHSPKMNSMKKLDSLNFNSDELVQMDSAQMDQLLQRRSTGHTIVPVITPAVTSEVLL